MGNVFKCRLEFSGASADHLHFQQDLRGWHLDLCRSANSSLSVTGREMQDKDLETFVTILKCHDIQAHDPWTL